MTCIVFTDTNRLAEKYCISRQDVFSLIEKNLRTQVHVEYLLLDASEYTTELGESPQWSNYKEILSDFFVGMGLTPSPYLSLFILGGDDVIPMPRINNPINENEILQADLLYCFKGNRPDELNADIAQCNVARLPLENGVLKTTINDDLQSFFNISHFLLETGIDVDNVVMTSTQSWLPASNAMVSGLPVIEPNPISEATKDNMYTSPRLSVDEKYVLDQYKQDLSKSDMLIFNLHGSDVPGRSSFYGEGLSGFDMPEAFNIEMLRNSNARIINTVACFGGRYIDYQRSDSMLLSSFFGGGVVLYAGSCSSALGRSGRFHNPAHDILIPAGMSESFMKLYSLYLFSGQTAGEAFLRAKCDYFNTCQSLDGPQCSLATVLMFNLFGLPILHINKQDTVTEQAMGIKDLPRRIDWKNKLEYKVVWSKSRSNQACFLEDIRAKVNDNIMRIRKVVENELYRYWGLNVLDLNCIESIFDNNKSIGYRFEYLSNKGAINKRSWAFTDINGRVKDVIHMK